MSEKHADAFQASIEDGRIALRFGAGSDDGAKVELTDRILLLPSVAKRLSVALTASLRDHEAKFGPVESPAGPTDPPHLEGRAGRLVCLVHGLGIAYAYEPSFRLCRGALLDRRLLLSINRADLGQRPEENLQELLGFMETPDDVRKAVCRGIPDAVAVHFGYEEGVGETLHKIYLEAEDAPAEQGPILLYRGFKWPLPGTRSHVLTRYEWYPSISVEETTRRLEAIYGGTRHESLAIARDVLTLAAGGAAPGDLRYLEVGEEGSPRRSYDLTLYDANLKVERIGSLLDRMRQRFSISEERLAEVYQPIRARRLGHLAGGVHRDGRDFFNVYYGVEWHHG